MNEKEALILLDKYNSGTATANEIKLLENWYSAESLRQKLSDAEADFGHLKEEIWEGTLQRANLKEEVVIFRETVPFYSKRWYRLSVAAALLVAGSGYLLIRYHFANGPSNPMEMADHISGGKNKATLTLASGQKIILSDAVQGKLAEEQGINIIKTENGEIIYRITEKSGNYIGNSGYNTISTAAGENYQVILPDGSKIKLNAISSLKYPASFSSAAERSVELKGEAYFEVAKDKYHPFKVKTHSQEVEVLGTHFDINSYTDNVGTKTTLLEGSVKVSPLGFANGQDRTALASFAVLLKPGQQAVQKANSFTILPADTEEVVAWTEGFFYFHSSSLEDVLKEAAKWYDLEIVYKGKIPADRFTGKIPKSVSLGKFIKMLQLSDIKFSIEGRKMIIY
ncbi:FecR family protein [Pedobacter cryoconitis]|uniref:FecR family protein n=1 Tax=Pedobacter cryoconitis TaxID=188932 RepID=A0A7X0J0E3_9SPHI|nr:FecR family protein [Pedobacter cryoconitis]MBB6498771.1 hypothetical protein [Pedobacter cryoconitis]